MKKLIKAIFLWAFKEEIVDLEAHIKGVLEAQRDIVIEGTLKMNSTIQNTERISKNLEKKHNRLDNMLDNFDISVDHHMYSRSWAVVSIQGQKQDFVKFMDLGTRDIQEIQRFLHSFERNVKIDTAPNLTPFFKIKR